MQRRGAGNFEKLWHFPVGPNDKLYSPQMVVAANTTKYTIENDLTKKRKERKNKHTDKWHVLI